MLKKIMYWALFYQFISMLCLGCYIWGGDVTLQWDANSPTPEGYKIFTTTESTPFDYDNPAWEGTETECTLTIPDTVAYIFCVRAFVGDAVSGDSNWLYYTSIPQPEAIHIPNRPMRLILEFN